jgi:hypothetical protein
VPQPRRGYERRERAADRYTSTSIARIAPEGSPAFVPGLAVTRPNSTARNVPKPSTTQITKRTNTCGFARKNFTTSRMYRRAPVLLTLKDKPAATYSPRPLRAKYHRR